MNRHILFLESRYRTWFWENVARELEHRQVNVSWIVQNPVFAPTIGTVHRLPLVDRRSIASLHSSDSGADKVPSSNQARLQRAASGDRSILYWGGNSNHYTIYWRNIEEIIGKARPTIVVGELGNFHTLLAAEVCDALGVPFFSVETSRYPVGRFSFFPGTTAVPVFGEGAEALRNVDVEGVIGGIVGGETVPSYMSNSVMRPSISSRIGRVHQQLTSSLKSTLLGERFNQKPLAIAVKDVLRRRRSRRQWIELVKNATEFRSDVDYKLLLPLQMQPELNLDVWGNAHRNQAELLRQVLETLPPRWRVLVKPNPKADRELSKELFEVMRSSDRVSPLPFGIAMSELLNQVDAVVTVTGTVLIEAILRSVPVFALADTLATDLYPQVRVQSVPQLSEHLEEVARGHWQPYDRPSELMRRLLITSYPGHVSSPQAFPRRHIPSNTVSVTNAVLDVLNRVSE